MTTTAFDDQFAPEPVAPVRQPYDTAAILRRNVADAEKEMQRQAERAESYAEAMRSLASYVGAGGYNADTVDAGVFEEKIRWGIGVIMARMEQSEAELLAIREDNHSMMLEIDGLRKELAAKQAATAPAVPTDEQIHAAYRNALGQSIRERDMPEIRKFARALLQSADHSEQTLEKVDPDCRACANRGQVNGLSQESYCDGCVYQGRSWRKNHFVDARKMADAIKRRCEACAILPCSCK